MKAVPMPTPLDRLQLGRRRKVPVVLQSEAAECGLACLAMIAGYHGHGVDLASLRRAYPTSLNGVTLATIIDIAARLDLIARPVRLELRDLGQLRRPSVLHWRFDHFVVLAGVGRRGIRIHDPSTGERRVPLAEAGRAFTGVALELWPSESFRPRDERRRVRLRDLVGRTAGLRRSLAQILILASALEVFAVTSPLYLQWVVDHVLVSGDRELLVALAVGFGLLVALEQTIALVRSWSIMHFGTLLSVQWQGNALTHLLRLPLSYFEKRHLGDVVSRFRSIDSIQRTLSTVFVEALVDGAVATAVAFMLWRYDSGLAGVCLGAVAIYGASRWLSYRPLRHAAEEQIVNLAKQESHFLETVRGVRALKLFAREENRRTAWLGLLVDQVNAGLRMQRLQTWLRFSNGLLLGAAHIAVVALAARAVLDGRFSAGMLVAFVAYQRQFSARVSALIDKTVELRMLRLHGERLADILLTPAETGHSEPALREVRGAAAGSAIEVRDVRFRYSDHEPFVLNGIDCTIAPGEAVAIAGPSGCGKSTLVHLLLGILAPTSGEIVVGGTSVGRGDPAALRRTVASVTQNDMLFAGTIADNISFFDERCDQERVEHCARLAAIHEEITGLPMGYNTHVGYMGSALSGGQQQRILLARALYKRPRILVLDEATSHLDVKRELLVAAAIRRLEITRVIVAHRPQTAATADRVLTLRGGRIAREQRLMPNRSALRAAAVRPHASPTDDGAVR
jgi:ATP-binding cassette subfamily B protein RaxB